MYEQIPAAAVADLPALAEGKRLGAHRATFLPARRLSWSEQSSAFKTRRMVVAGVILVIAVVAFAAAPLFGVFLVVVLAAIWGISIPRNRRVLARMNGRELHFYEQGLINLGGKQPGPAVIRWDEASVLQGVTRHYRNGTHTSTTYLYRVDGPDGAQAVISGIIGGIGGLERPDEWGPGIQQAVTSAQLPGALAAVERGETVTFGGMSLNRAGISSGQKSVNWDELQELKVKDGYVSLKVAGKWLPLSTTAVAAIPNYFVFYALAERMHTTSRSAH